jgi:glucose-1-phosphatase
MIKNIVFDLGNVLISFKPADYLDNMDFTAEYKNILIREVFKGREWQLIDNGNMSVGEAIQKISERSLLNPQEIAAVFDLRTKILHPIDRNIEMLPELKKRGFMLYFLSNFPDDIFDEVFDRYPFFKLFDGGIISARVNASKPERRIFEILIEKYSLKAEECVFVDDDESNVRTAGSMGMSGILVLDSEDLPQLINKKLYPG